MQISKELLANLSPPAREAFLLAHEKAKAGDDYELRTFVALKEYPVSIEEFIQSPEYLNSDAIYPLILEELIKLNNPLIEGCKFRSRLWTLYSEAILTGPIGTGKTTIALISILYQLYVLSCFLDPHVPFGLDSSSEIIFAFQNKTEKLAKAVDFDRFKAMVSLSPYFRKYYPFDGKVKSELRFPNRIIAKPVAGNSDALIGQNVIGGIIDELNFMETIERSSRSYDGREYDQATALYQSIARRRASRFMKYGRLPGMLCLVSSRRYPGQFTDRKESERRRQLAETGTTSIYLFDKRAWEVKPKGTYCGETFPVFVGNEARQPRILAADEAFSGSSDIIHIPIEHRHDFENDLPNALRDIAGVSTQAVRPYLTNRAAVTECFGKHGSILTRDNVIWPDQKIDIHRNQLHRPELIRFAHLDLSRTVDATGIVVGCVSGFDKIDRGDVMETLPHIRIDFALQVFPPKGGEILYESIRKFLYWLRTQGLNLCFVSADSYQSTDTLQILKRKGIVPGIVSMDKTPVPYQVLKSALYDGRVDLPQHDQLAKELLSLEWDERREKVDHSPHGSKDLADALAGVVYGLSRRREVWNQHGVNPDKVAPTFVYYLRQTKDGWKN
jgi:hypothetical protein